MGAGRHVEGDLFQMHVHRLAIAAGMTMRAALPRAGQIAPEPKAGEVQHPGRRTSLIARSQRARAAPRQAPGELGLLDPGFILPPKLYGRPLGEAFLRICARRGIGLPDSRVARETARQCLHTNLMNWHRQLKSRCIALPEVKPRSLWCQLFSIPLWSSVIRGQSRKAARERLDNNRMDRHGQLKTCSIPVPPNRKALALEIALDRKRVDRVGPDRVNRIVGDHETFIGKVDDRCRYGIAVLVLERDRHAHGTARCPASLSACVRG